MKKYSIPSLAAIFLISSIFIFGSYTMIYAQFPDQTGGGLEGETNNQNGNNAGSSQGTENPDISFQLENPLSGVNTISDFVKKILDIVLTLGIPIVALAIIYSGFLFVAARGNTEKLGQAKKTFLYTIIGAAVLLGAWLLAQVLSETITQLSS